jgi:4-hydroxyacetophenone monooxygenase
LNPDREFFPLHPEQLAAASDEALRATVDAAQVVPLLCALALLTDDPELLSARFTPHNDIPPEGPRLQGGLSEPVLAEARSLALEHLRRLRDSADVAERPVNPATLERTIAFATGGQDESLRALIGRELDIPHDADAPGWRIQDLAPGRSFRVAVIGAGMSGILCAHRLRQAGIACDVFEKGRDVGGTWLENSYPGCRLDTPNFAYSYSFAQNPYWPEEFSGRDAILEYYITLASRMGLRELIQLETEVLSATYDETRCLWILLIRNGAGEERCEEFNAVVSAVGQLNRPGFPALPGIDSFAGEAWHTARWRHDVDLGGKRVGVIGTGASAYQVVPTILPEVDSLTVFQRNPPWMLPTPNYHNRITAPHQWLLATLPHYSAWHRFFQVWITLAGRWDLARVDPDFHHPISVSAGNEALRQALLRNLEKRYSDRPDLLATQTPAYPPGAKRMLRDNGVWSAALKDRRTTLETRPIAAITPSGVRMQGGSEQEFDVLIYATGFRAEEFLMPMRVVGEKGRDLHEWWQGDARAYLGSCMPGFPNLFCMYGPNTNLAVHGSTILFAESSANYIVKCLRLLLEGDHQALSVTEEAFDDFNRMIDRENALMAWGASSVSSWYKNALGRVSQNWPLPLKDFVIMTEAPDPSHFRFSPLG